MLLCIKFKHRNKVTNNCTKALHFAISGPAYTLIWFKQKSLYLGISTLISYLPQQNLQCGVIGDRCPYTALNANAAKVFSAKMVSSFRFDKAVQRQLISP